MKLLTDLIIRVILIIAITDSAIFYVIVSKKLVITVPFVISVIIVTLVPLIINIWFCLHRNGII